MLVSLGDFAVEQTRGTTQTIIALIQFLNYCAYNPEASIVYKESYMILTIHSDASYLSVPRARSRVGGYLSLGRNTSREHNGPIHCDATILKNIMASTAEAEIGALYVNAQKACPIKTILEELGHLQPPTPLQTDNYTAMHLSNKTLKQKRSKAIDMMFYWLQDRVKQGQFYIFGLQKKKT